MRQWIWGEECVLFTETAYSLPALRDLTFGVEPTGLVDLKRFLNLDLFGSSSKANCLQASSTC